MENKTNADKPLTKKEIARADRAKAIAYLRGEYLKTGDTVYVILRNVSRSGMARYLDLFVVNAERKPLRITWNVAKALAVRYDRNKNALRVDGCGFDAAHAITADLAWTLFGNSDSLTHCWL